RVVVRREPGRSDVATGQRLWHRCPVVAGARPVLEDRVVALVPGREDARAPGLVEIEVCRFADALDLLAVPGTGVDLEDRGRRLLAALARPANEADEDLAGFVGQHASEVGPATVLAATASRAHVWLVGKERLLVT